MIKDPMGIKGTVIVELFGPDGGIKHREVVHNIVTTAGDEYSAKKVITGIAPASPSAPTAASGMKLGTGTTAAAKSGAGAALVTYISGSNNPFDSSFPDTVDETGDTGWSARYKTTWPAGDSTNSAITEAVVVNDAGTDATSSAANTYARVTFTAVNKGANDSLAITWKHTYSGA